jgi:hypothetical protein
MGIALTFGPIDVPIAEPLKELDGFQTSLVRDAHRESTHYELVVASPCHTDAMIPAQVAE